MTAGACFLQMPPELPGSLAGLPALRCYSPAAVLTACPMHVFPPAGLAVVGVYLLCPEAAFAGSTGQLLSLLHEMQLELAGEQRDAGLCSCIPAAFHVLLPLAGGVAGQGPNSSMCGVHVAWQGGRLDGSRGGGSKSREGGPRLRVSCRPTGPAP